MQSDYDPHKIENAIQQNWQKNAEYKVSEDSDKEKFYCLEIT